LHKQFKEESSCEQEEIKEAISEQDRIIRELEKKI